MFITNTKSKKPRDFPISSKPAERLKEMAAGRPADDPMFLTKVMVTSQKKKVIGGLRLHPDNFYARVKNTTGAYMACDRQNFSSGKQRIENPTSILAASTPYPCWPSGDEKS